MAVMVDDLILRGADGTIPNVYFQGGISTPAPGGQRGPATAGQGA